MSEGGIRLRPLGADDLDRVMELEHELFGAGAWSRGAYVEELRASDRRYVAALDPAGTVVGYAGILLAEDASVMTVGVAATHRRRGIGRLLLDALVEHALAARARNVFLEVRASDAGAQSLYAGAGFEPVGVRRRYYEAEGEDAVVMRLVLRPRGRPIGAEVL